jgi:hypothetical protein
VSSEKARSIRQSVLAGSFLLLLGVLGWRLLHLYSVGRPYDALLPPTRDFLTMALAGDSSGLVRTGASASAVQWGLQTSRENPTVLSDLLRDLSVSGGRRTGEEIFVLFHGTSRGICLNRPLAVTFTGSLAEARIQTISTDCGKRP